MKAKTTVAIVSLFIVGVGAGVLGTMVLSGDSTPEAPSSDDSSLSTTKYKILEDKLQRTEATVTTQKELLAANEDFLDSLHEFDLSIAVTSEQSREQLEAKVRVQELRVLVGAERSDPQVIVNATEEVKRLAESLKGN